MPRSLRPLCNFCAAPLGGGVLRVHLCHSCLLPFTLINLKAEAWQAGQIPLPFNPWRTARSRMHRPKMTPRAISARRRREALRAAIAVKLDAIIQRRRLRKEGPLPSQTLQGELFVAQDAESAIASDARP